MKKNLFLLATAALVLASCNNDVKIDENTVPAGSNAQKEIKFVPVNHTPKRAAGTAKYNAVDGVAYPQNYEMRVVAYSIPETGDAGNYFGSADANSAPLFAYISEGEGNTYWGGKTSSDKQYWPLSPATLNFLAVSNNGSPTADVVSETFASNYASQVTVTLGDNKPQTAATGVGQHDLMYAFGTASVTKTGNALTFPTKVDMTFNHALAWVYFRVKAGNDASEAISIKGINLNGAKYGGTFQAKVSNYNLTTPALAWDAENTKWTAASNGSDDIASPNFSAAYDTDADGDSDNDSKALVNGTFFGVGDGILVVPTNGIAATNSISSIDIEYYLNGNLYKFNYVPTELIFEKGKKYIYDITMTLHEIYVNASVEDWTDGGTTFVDVPTLAYKENAVAGTYDVANTAGKYSVTIAGCEASTTYNVSEAEAADWLAETNNTYASAATSYTSDASGNLKVYFTVTANASTARNATIVLTKNADTKNTKITISQAAAD